MLPDSLNCNQRRRLLIWERTISIAILASNVLNCNCSQSMILASNALNCSQSMKMAARVFKSTKEGVLSALEISSLTLRLVIQAAK